MLANVNPPSGFSYAGSSYLIFLNDDFQPIENDVHVKLTTNIDNLEISLNDPTSGEVFASGTEIDLDFSATQFQYGCLEVILVTEKTQHVRVYAELTYNGESIKTQIESNFIDPGNQARDLNCMFDIYPPLTILTPDANSFPLYVRGILGYEYNDQGGKITQMRGVLDNGALFEEGEGTVTYSDNFTVETNQSSLDKNLKVQLPGYGLYTASTKLEGVSPTSLDKTIVNEACFLVINVKGEKQFVDGQLCHAPSGIITSKTSS